MERGLTERIGGRRGLGVRGGDGGEAACNGRVLPHGVRAAMVGGCSGWVTHSSWGRGWGATAKGSARLW